MEFLFTPILEVIKCLVPPVERRVDFIVHMRRNINELTNEMEKLKSMRDDIQEKVEVARRRGEDIHTMVNDWRVSTIEIEVSTLSRAIEHNNGCFRGGIVARYRIGKEAKEKFHAINVIQSEGNFNNNVSRPPPPVTIEHAATPDFEKFDSTLEAMKQIMEALKDEKISSIGLYGMGGVGKTTLMKVVGKQMKKEGIFDEVVMVTVSQNQVLEKIQGEIAERLGLTIVETSEFGRAGRLMEALKKKKRVLIILDDLWAELELAKVGIPSGDDHKGCKLVITTRRLDACSTMGIQANVEVKVLSEQDAWHLFKKNAGDAVEFPALQKVAWEIAKECQGLPIAIVTLGRALRDKDPIVWDDALGQLKKSIFTHIEDWEIDRDDLLKYGMGEGIFDDVDTLKEARARVHTITEKLISSCLLLKDRDKNVVSMHDVVRDVAKSIASKDENGFIVKAGTYRNWPERVNLKKCMRMSLVRNEIDKLPDRPECPQLLTLSLKHVKELGEIPNSFFGGMGALANLDLSETKISSLPQSLSCLTNLRTLDLNHVNLSSDISLIGKLKKLEMLFLRGRSIRTLSEEIGDLTNLKLLELTHNRRLETIPPNLISRLTNLEELYMGESFNGWEIEGSENGNNASLVELASLSKLSVLHLDVENVKCLSTRIPTTNWENLTTFSLRVGPRIDYVLQDPIEFPRSMWLDFNESSYEKPADWVNVLFGKTDKLQLKCNHGLENALQLEAGGFNNLKYLQMKKCYDVEYIISMVEGDVQQTVFNSLEILSLSNLDNLKGVCHGPLPNGFFNKLTELEVKRCSKLINVLLPSDLLARLQNLEKLSVDCCKVSEVFNYQELDEGHDTILLSKLRILILRKLDQLSTIWKGIIPLGSFHNLERVDVLGCDSLTYLFSPTMAQRLQQLKELIIRSCGKMVEIVCSVVDETETFSCVLSTPVFPDLRILCIKSCDSLKHLLPMRLARGALQLEEIEIINCDNIGVIIASGDKEEIEGNMMMMMLPQLKTLKLAELPKLSSMWSEVLPIDLPCLELFYFYGCQNLKRIPIGLQRAPKLTEIYAEDKCFEGLEWEDESVKMRLHSLLQ